MKFIPLIEIINSIAACAKADPKVPEHPLLEEAYKNSYAAARLDQVLHNTPENRPKIYDHNITGLPRRNDVAYQDISEILLHMAPWITRSVAAYLKWQEDIKQNGMTRDNILPPIEMYYGKFKDNNFELRANEISFEECEIINFLEINNIAHILTIPGDENITKGQSVDAEQLTQSQVINTSMSANGSAEVLNQDNEIQAWQIRSFELCESIRTVEKRIKKKDLARQIEKKLQEQGVTGRGGKIISISSILRYGIK